jgi:hypothetical protein
MYWTWATWGDLSIDAGHEIYVPAVLSEGQKLYRDVWFHYGPLSPYFNSLLFGIFGRQLAVLYFAGAASALGSGIFLFLTGVELEFTWAGWTAGAVVVIEAFEPGLFSFPLPYSFASVYGCLAVCALLWLLARGLSEGKRVWMGSAGMLAATALLLKLEFGVAAYGGLTMAMALRWLATKDWKRLGRDIVAVLPSVAICAAAIAWMVSIRGVSFITQENILSWPTSFFMRMYGKQWLAHTGLELNAEAFLGALKDTLFVTGMLVGLRQLLSEKRHSRRGYLLLALLAVGLVAYWRLLLWTLTPIGTAQAAFFPRAMVLYTVIGVGILCRFYGHRLADWKTARLLLVLAFSSLLAFRILLNMQPDGYAIYYNGPVTLGYVILLFAFLGGNRAPGKVATRIRALVVVGCLSVVTFRAAYLSKDANSLVALETKYGTLRVNARVKENYEAAIAFLKEKSARNEAVLVLPEDTSLYFLSDTHAPTRVYLFTPGVPVPGAMTEELFREIEAKNVKYLLWSNRTFVEYGVPVFGRDFNQELVRYLSSRYKPMGLLVPGGERHWGLTFRVWQREDEIAKQ